VQRPQLVEELRKLRELTNAEIRNSNVEALGDIVDLLVIVTYPGVRALDLVIKGKRRVQDQILTWNH
jgi:hypothetical protein